MWTGGETFLAFITVSLDPPTNATFCHAQDLGDIGLRVAFEDSLDCQSSTLFQFGRSAWCSHAQAFEADGIDFHSIEKITTSRNLDKTPALRHRTFTG
jgi:hypothetical protein